MIDITTVQTRREFLVAKGLAQPGRGKFSFKAHAALSEAIAKGVTFSDMVEQAPATPKRKASVTKDKPVKIDPKTFDPAEVRKWAKSKGIEVNARGRLSGILIQDYLAEVGDAAPARSDNSSRDAEIQELAAQLRFEEWWGNKDYPKIVKHNRDCCNRCRYSIGWCKCEGGPYMLLPTGEDGLIPLTPVKKK